MSLTDFSPDHIIDDRRPLDQLRAWELREIAWAFGLPCKDFATKAEILPLLNANGIQINHETLKRAWENREKRLTAHRIAAEKSRKAPGNPAAKIADKVPADLQNMKWLALEKLAKQHGIDVDEVAPKGEQNRAEKVRDAIREAIKSGQDTTPGS